MFDDKFLDSLFNKVFEFHMASPARSIIKRSDDGFTFTYNQDFKDGISIDFMAQRGEYWLACNGWHEHSEFIGLNANSSEEDKAQRGADQLASILNGQARLEVHRAGSIAYKWIMIFGESNNTTGLLLYPFWLRKSTKILKNNVPIQHLKNNPWK